MRTRPGPLRLALLLALVLPAHARGQEGGVPDTVPSTPDPGAAYLIYLHGRIIEVEGRRPTHPDFGVYEYDAVLQALAGHGFEVISEARPADTQVATYAEHVAEQVRSLLDGGVPPERIAVVGFSKGGMITATVTLTGAVLSIHEASDDIGISCAPLFERSPDTDITQERRIDTGERHGAFYRPRPEWLEPLFEWLSRQP